MKHEEKIDMIAEMNEEAIEFNGIEGALIGWVERFGLEPILIYDYDKTIRCLMDEGMTEEEAVEWYGYNTIGTWAGDGTPCFLHRFDTEEVQSWQFLKMLNDWWTKTAMRITETLGRCGRWFRQVGR